MALHRRELVALSSALAANSLVAGCTSRSTDPSERPRETSSLSPTTDSPTEVSTTPSPSSTDERSSGTATIDVDDPVREFAYENSRFGVDLLREIVADDRGANLLVSPYSVGVALALAYAGARGETRDGMRETLRYPFDGEELHAAIADLSETLVPADQPETPTPTPTPSTDRIPTTIPLRFRAANALWGQSGFPFSEEYLSLLRTYYHSGFRQLDFRSSPSDAHRTINDWIAERTQDTIPELLPSGAISPQTRLVLTNAVYFQGGWEEPFWETEEAPFTSIDGTTADVPMMTTRERAFPYASVDGHRLVELPYRGGEFGMVVVLPRDGTFEQFERSLTGERLRRLLNRLERDVGTVSLPKFRFESEFRLSGALSALGMSNAFGAGADFSGMIGGDSDDGFGIDEVYHDTFVSVDEEGTTAAAATGAVFEVSAVMGDDPFEFVADRPFLFLIRERRTGAVTFLGRVVDAEAARPD